MSFFPMLRRNNSVFCWFSNSVDTLCKFRNFPISPSFLRLCIINQCWTLSNAFFASTDMILWLYLFGSLMWFLYVKVILYNRYCLCQNSFIKLTSEAIRPWNFGSGVCVCVCVCVCFFFFLLIIQFLKLITGLLWFSVSH